MLTVTEPQVWTLIGVFSAVTIGMLTIVSTMFIQVMRSEFRATGSRIDTLSLRLDNLDRGVQALMRHTFGIDRD